MLSSQSSDSSYFSPRFLVGLFLIVVAAMIWRWTRNYSIPLFDLYPLYYGGQAWIETGNAYDLSAVVPAYHHTYLVFRIGNAYPLPAILVTLPLTLLPPQFAATIWVGGLLAALICLLRLNGAPFWLLLYVPFLEGLRIEQYTVLVLVLQLLALWALQTKRYMLLALSSALILTKPTHGILFAGYMFYLLVAARQWRQPAAALLLVWGGAFLVDPRWLQEWFAAVSTYTTVAAQPILWPLALFAIPLLFNRDILSSLLVVQLALAPFPGVYAASSLTLGVFRDPWSRWLSLASFLWPALAVVAGKPIATALILVLPVVVLSLLRQRYPAALRAAYRGSSPD